MNNERACIVEVEFDWNVYKRESWNTTSYLEDYKKSIMFCNILNWQPAVVKELLTELLINDDVRLMFPEYWAGSVWSTLDKIDKEYKIVNTKYEKIKARIDFLNEDISKIEVDENQINNMQIRLQDLLAQYNNLTSWVDVKVLEAEQLRVKNNMLNLQNEIIAQQWLFDKLNSELVLLEEQWRWLLNNECPTCWSIVSKEDDVIKAKLVSIKHQYISKKDMLNDISDTIDSKNNLLEEMKQSYNSLDEQIKNAVAANSVVMNKDELEKDIAHLQQLIIVGNERLTTRNARQEELDKLVTDLIELQQNKLFTYKEMIWPKWNVNKLLEEKLKGLLPWYKVVLFEDQTWWDSQKAVFKLYKDWVLYNDLSRWQKILTNVQLSVMLMQLCNMNLPLLIDDGESLSKDNLDEIMRNLDSYWLTAVVTFVNEKKLKLDATA